MKRKTYWVTASNEHYAEIIDFCGTHCDTFSAVINDRAMPSRAALDFLEQGGLDIVTIRNQTSWPGTGTVLAGYTCKVHYIKIDARSMSVVKSVGGLYSWVHPDLPEDIAFYRPDGEAFFAVVGHESISFFVLEDNELSSLRTAIPALILSDHAPI
jgi:hypothetical protein